MNDDLKDHVRTVMAEARGTFTALSEQHDSLPKTQTFDGGLPELVPRFLVTEASAEGLELRVRMLERTLAATFLAVEALLADE